MSAQSPSHTSWTAVNPFEQKNFIGNAGQIQINQQFPGFEAQFEAVSQGIHYFIGNEGIITMRCINKKTDVEDTRKKNDEEMEKDRFQKIQIFELFKFVNTSPTLKVLAGKKVENYYTFCTNSKSTLTAHAHETVIYKGIYPDIDLVLGFNKDTSGIELSFILGPTANINNIGIESNYLSQAKICDNGDLISDPDSFHFTFHTPHIAPILNPENTCGYSVSENTIRFFSPDSRIAQTSTISIWMNSTSNLSGNQGAFDVDYDKSGNVYVYGGSDRFILNKYDPSGNLLWSNIPFGDAVYMYGDFAVDRRSGNIYIVEGIVGGIGARIVKLNPNGSTLNFYNGHPQMSELSRVAFDPCSGRAIVVGGGKNQGSFQTCYLDTNLVNFSPVNFLDPVYNQWQGDMTCLSFDNAGHFFSAICASGGTFTNQMYSFNLSNLNTPIYAVQNGFNIQEFSSLCFHLPQNNLSNALNGLATSNNHVYSYDGLHLSKFKSTSPVLLNQLQIETGDNTKLYWSGIAANNCDMLLLADKNRILQLDSNLKMIDTIYMPDYVYDIRYREDGTIYACGKNFVSVFKMENMSCLSCSLSVTQPDSCRGTGSATVAINGNYPPFSAVWNTFPPQNGNIANGLLPGNNYFVTIKDSYACSDYSITETANVIFPQTFTMETLIEPSSCFGVSDGSINIVSLSGVEPYFYDWTNGPKGISLNTFFNLTAGVYTLNVTDSRGCRITSQFPVPANTFEFMGFEKVNVFSPNDDDINDLFYPVRYNQKSINETAALMEDYQLYIYNRWGTLIFESSKYKHAWDGYTTSGEQCTEGTYIWVLHATSACSNAQTFSFRGTVQMIR